jgi:hypothetical protein
MPWQRYVFDVALEIDETNIDPNTGLPLPAYNTIIIVVNRQQGKSELIFPVMIHRSIGFEQFGAQRILYTAQTADDSRKKWRDVHVARLEKSPFNTLFEPRLALNKEAILWVNGSAWSPGSTTAKTGGTGDTLDLGVIDEAWAADKRIEAAMRPAMLTRPSKQMWIMSMVPGISRAGTDESQYLRQKVKVGREAVLSGCRSGIAYFEFGAEEGMDPGDPATWWSCMPALGHTVSERAIQDDFQMMDLVDFCAEYLSWWPSEQRASWVAIRRASWEDREDPQSCIVGRPALAIDAEEDRNRAVIMSAGKRDDGDWHVELIEPGQQVPVDVEGMDWAVDRIIDIYDRQDALTVVIDPRGPAQSFIMPLRNRDIHVTTPNTLEIAAACGRFMDAVKPAPTEDDEDDLPAVRLWQLGQPELARSVASARKVVSGKNRTFTWERCEGSAELYGATLAMHGYEQHGLDDYDVRESVAAADDECPKCGAYPAYPGGPTYHYDDCERE